jgi:hypothetical protein
LQLDNPPLYARDVCRPGATLRRCLKHLLQLLNALPELCSVEKRRNKSVAKRVTKRWQDLSQLSPRVSGNFRNTRRVLAAGAVRMRSLGD